MRTPTDEWMYAYDPFGDRIATTHNGGVTQYLGDPIRLGNIAATLDATGKIIARYDHGYGLLSRTDATGNSVFYTFSAIGNTSELSDPFGTVLNTYSIEPFGVSPLDSDRTHEPFRFIGEYGVVSDQNGWEFMRARFYQPEVGRYEQVDPIGITGGTNLYEYSRNNPVTNIDADGRKAGEIGRIGRRLLELERELYKTLPVLDKWRDRFIEETGESDPLPNLPDFSDPDPNPVPPEPDPSPSPTPEPVPTPTPPAGPGPGGSGSSNVAQPVDPNDKLAPSGFGQSRFIQPDRVLAYTIRFENLASATGAAATITIGDTLDTDFDLSTFELTEIKLADETITIPSGLDHYEGAHSIVANGHEILVQVDARLDYEDRELTVTLTAIDPYTG